MSLFAPTREPLELREYQETAVSAVLAGLERSPLLVAPTGSGKTVMGATVVDRSQRRTLWLAHRRELIQQAADRLRSLGLHCGIIMAGHTAHPAAPVQVAAIQTLSRRELPPADLIVVDEAHHARADSFRALLASYPGVPMLGLTATPFRLDGRGLGDVGFGAIIVAAHADELIADGTLVAPRIYAPPGPDMGGVAIRRGDFVPRELALRADTPKLVGDIVETWQRLARGLRTVVFAVNVAHSQHIVEAFRAVGVAAEHLDGSVSKPQRDATLHRLRVGYTTVVSNCQVLTEGWDLPALECGILARPTASLGLYLQMIGRVMRTAYGKDGAIILDHAGNVERLTPAGPFAERLSYSLDDEPVRTVARDGAAAPPMKRCPECLLMAPAGALRCDCGAEFRAQRAALPRTAEGELVEYVQRPRVPFAEQLQVWQEIQEVRARRGYRDGWAAHRFRERFGHWPTTIGDRLIDMSTATHAERRQIRAQIDAARARKATA